MSTSYRPVRETEDVLRDVVVRLLLLKIKPLLPLDPSALIVRVSLLYRPREVL